MRPGGFFGALHPENGTNRPPHASEKCLRCAVKKEPVYDKSSVSVLLQRVKESEKNKTEAQRSGFGFGRRSSGVSAL